MGIKSHPFAFCRSSSNLQTSYSSFKTVWQVVLWSLQSQKSTLTFLSYWQVSHWLAARGCECSAAGWRPPECWKCRRSSWLFIIALIVVWQPELHERNVMNIQSFQKIWSDYKFPFSFFSSIDMISALIKISPVEHWVSFLIKGG